MGRKKGVELTEKQLQKFKKRIAKIGRPKFCEMACIPYIQMNGWLCGARRFSEQRVKYIEKYLTVLEK